MAFEGTLQEITVRMHGETLQHSFIEAQQGDTASRKVRIRLKTFGGKDFVIPYGATALLTVHKSDGHKVYNSCEVEDQSSVIVTLTSQALACPGEQLSQIYLFTEDGDIKTQKFYIRVPKAVYSDDAIESADEFGILLDMIAKVESLEDGVTFTPHVSETGDLSWTNDGGLENPETVNIMGPEGPEGARIYTTTANPISEPSDMDDTEILVYETSEGLRGIRVGDFVICTKSYDMYRVTTIIDNMAVVALVGNIKGASGKDGVSVSSVKQTTTSSADGGNNVVTITLSDGTKSTFTVKNGSKGSTGDAGYSPVKGKDYFTDADKTEIVAQVIAGLPVYTGEVV